MNMMYGVYPPLDWWFVPVVITILVWTAAILWPIPRQVNHYVDVFYGGIQRLIFCVGALTITSFVWIVAAVCK